MCVELMLCVKGAGVYFKACDVTADQLAVAYPAPLLYSVSVSLAEFKKAAITSLLLGLALKTICNGVPEDALSEV